MNRNNTNGVIVANNRENGIEISDYNNKYIIL